MLNEYNTVPLTPQSLAKMMVSQLKPLVEPIFDQNEDELVYVSLLYATLRLGKAIGFCLEDQRDLINLQIKNGIDD